MRRDDGRREILRRYGRGDCCGVCRGGIETDVDVDVMGVGMRVRVGRIEGDGGETALIVALINVTHIVDGVVIFREKGVQDGVIVVSSTTDNALSVILFDGLVVFKQLLRQLLHVDLPPSIRRLWRTERVHWWRRDVLIEIVVWSGGHLDVVSFLFVAFVAVLCVCLSLLLVLVASSRLSPTRRVCACRLSSLLL